MRRTKIVTSAAVGLVLVGAGTAAGAVVPSSPVDSLGVIHGCLTKGAVNGSLALVLQDVGTTCPRGTTPVSWNQVGPEFLQVISVWVTAMLGTTSDYPAVFRYEACYTTPGAAAPTLFDPSLALAATAPPTRGCPTRRR